MLESRGSAHVAYQYQAGQANVTLSSSISTAMGYSSSLGLFASMVGSYANACGSLRK